jgi:cell division septum initiation protein DivIVA
MKTLNIKGLEQIFEKNLSDEYLHKAISKIISYEIAKTTQELEELKVELKAYEERFIMSSEVFFSKFNAGELEDNADFFEWSALYQIHLRAFERLKILKSE